MHVYTYISEDAQMQLEEKQLEINPYDAQSHTTTRTESKTGDDELFTNFYILVYPIRTLFDAIGWAL